MPTLDPEQERANAKRLMLDLINEERAQAGLVPLVMGTSRAAQVHAENSLSGCVSSHWGLDGTKPYMRYTLAGGYHNSNETAYGLDVCLNAGSGYAATGDINGWMPKALDSFMGSTGHRRTILDPKQRKVSIGIAWDTHNNRVVLLFETDHIEYERLPEIQDGTLSLKGSFKSGATLITDERSAGLAVQVYHDPPLREFTRGQISRAYGSNNGIQVASLRVPLDPGSSYRSDSFSKCVSKALSPGDFPADIWAPRTHDESKELHAEARAAYEAANETCTEITIKHITAKKWETSGIGGFDVQADVGALLEEHGPGVYTIYVFGELDGETTILSEYSIFHGTEPPAGYSR